MGVMVKQKGTSRFPVCMTRWTWPLVKSWLTCMVGPSIVLGEGRILPVGGREGTIF